MPWLRRLVRLPLLVLHLLLGALLSLLLVHGDARNPRPLNRRITRWWLHAVTTILGVRLRVSGAPGPGPVLLTAPHLSWLDIPVLGGAHETAFLSKEEVRDWPVVGWLAARAGTLFISRGHRQSMEEAVDEMAAALGNDRQVVVFPEGTTTSGELRRFKGRLLKAAVTAGTPVQPVMLRYPGDGGTHPAVPFVGDATLVEHIWGLCGESGLVAEIAYLEPFDPTGLTTNEMARRAEGAVRRALAQEIG